jgi:DNA-binding HxlR family transcriptional regulator
VRRDAPIKGAVEILTFRNHTIGMIMELLAHKHYLRVLQAVQRRPMRFGELQKELDLNPAQVDRAVKFLSKGLWVVPRVVPSKRGRMLVARHGVPGVVQSLQRRCHPAQGCAGTVGSGRAAEFRPLIGLRPLEWTTKEDLQRQARLLAAEL